MIEAILAKLSDPRYWRGFIIMFSPDSSKNSMPARSLGKTLWMSSIVLEMAGVSIVLGGAAGGISGLTAPMAFLRSVEISFMSSDRILNMSMSSSILFSRSLTVSFSSLIGILPSVM